VVAGRRDDPYDISMADVGSELQAAPDAKKAARADNFPKLDFFAKYALVGRDSDTYPGAWEDAGSEYYTLGFKVTLNLFDGRRIRERIRQADHEMRVKRPELEQTRRDLAEAERAREADLEAARDRVSLADARRDLADVEERAAKSRLQSCKISAMDYRQKAVAARNAADALLMAHIDVVLASKAIEWMTLE
jgi:outer membrane protein TolC